MSILDRLRSGWRGLMTEGTAPAGYDGASGRRRVKNFGQSSSHINALLASDAPALRDRSRELTRNHSNAKAAKRSYTANAVGTGIRTSFQHPEEGRNKALRQLYEDWCWEADADGIGDYYGLQALITRSVFVSGEAFVRRIDRRQSEDLAVPLQLQLIDPAQLPLWKTNMLPDGGCIRMGIEFDSAGRRTAYWFLRRHPGDWTARIALDDPALFLRVPAAEVLHVFEPEEIGQIRGEPRMAPVLVDYWLMGQYDQAELERKRTGALFAGFILEEDAENLPTDGPAADDGTAEATLEPGTLQVIKGKSIEFSTPPDVGTGYEPFQYRNQTKAAAGVGVPYAATTGDLKGASYSSMRAGALEFRRQLEQFQWHTLIPQFCRPVTRWLLDAAVLSGRAPVPAGEWRRSWRAIMAKVTFVPARWDWVDPLKDIKGEQIAVACGFKARSQVVEEQGYTAEEVDERRAADAARAQKLGLPAAPQPGDNTIGPPEHAGAPDSEGGNTGGNP